MTLVVGWRLHEASRVAATLLLHVHTSSVLLMALAWIATVGVWTAHLGHSLRLLLLGIAPHASRHLGLGVTRHLMCCRRAPLKGRWHEGWGTTLCDLPAQSSDISGSTKNNPRIDKPFNIPCDDTAR